MDNFFSLIYFLPDEITELLKLLDKMTVIKITELRVRKDKPLIIYIYDKAFFITNSGKLINHYSDKCYKINAQLFNIIIEKACNYSFHTNIESMIKGYITTANGVRIGVAASAVSVDGAIKSVNDISSLNIRIPHYIHNCSRPVLNELYVNKCPSIIVAGAPASGKTTLLRDMSALLSGGFAGQYRKVCIIDERCEMSSGFDLGINCDVISNYSKAQGIELAVRAMSPEIIICDELGNDEETNSIKFGFDSGVSFIVSAHAASLHQLISRSVIRQLIETGQFEYIVLLKHYTDCYEIYRITESNLENGRTDTDTDIFLYALSDGNTSIESPYCFY
jgi:stage III sporulation protein AA